jgi:hypothetical protein
MSILDKLKSEQVFQIYLEDGDNVAEFWECCDGYFSCHLTASEMYQLIDELTAIAERMNIAAKESE